MDENRFLFQHPVFKSYADKYFSLDQWIDPSNPNFGKALPTRLYVGMVIYADGVNLNPGSGIGYYRWNGTVWVYIG